jgi:hypothetical protein
MLKKLLYLYNDGHIPFPHLVNTGLGYKPQKIGNGVRFDENMNPIYFADNDLTEEEAEQLNNQFRIYNEEHQDQYPRNHGPETEDEAYLNSLPELTEQEIDEMDWRPIEELEEIYINKEQQEKELTNINSRIKDIKGTIDDIPKLEKDIESIDKNIKDEKKKIIINNIEKSKKISFITTQIGTDFKTFFSKVKKGQIKDTNEKHFTQNVNDIIDDLLNIDLKKITITSFSDTLNNLIEEKLNIAKKYKDEVIDVIANISHGFLEAYIDRVESEHENALRIITDLLFKLSKPKLSGEISDIDLKNTEIEKQIEKLKLKKIGINHKIESTKKLKEYLKEEQREYNDRDQHFKRREQSIKSKYDLIKSEKQEQLLLQETEKQAEEKPIKISKPKKIQEEKTTKGMSNLQADAINRTNYIDENISSNGKDLEDYLSKAGQTILQFITGDTSKVHDNESNKLIPKQKIVLANGDIEDLHHAVILDLYNDNNVYEIKNYKQYSSTDAIIPIQATKLEGTHYFVPYYLGNGNLYNIELRYTDPKTGEIKNKFILPENENGRVLHLIYRLSDGLYEFKPLQDKTKFVNLDFVPSKTRDGKQLYKFSSTILQPCKDHYGSSSFNIAPYLRKIDLKK